MAATEKEAGALIHSKLLVTGASARTVKRSSPADCTSCLAARRARLVCQWTKPTQATAIAKPLPRTYRHFSEAKAFMTFEDVTIHRAVTPETDLRRFFLLPLGR